MHIRLTNSIGVDSIGDTHLTPKEVFTRQLNVAAFNYLTKMTLTYTIEGREVWTTIEVIK